MTKQPHKQRNRTERASLHERHKQVRAHLSEDLRDASVSVEDVTVEKADGEEVPRAMDASNLRVTDLDLEDDVRAERLEGDNE